MQDHISYTCSWHGHGQGPHIITRACQYCMPVLVRAAARARAMTYEARRRSFIINECQLGLSYQIMTNVRCNGFYSQRMGLTVHIFLCTWVVYHQQQGCVVTRDSVPCEPLPGPRHTFGPLRDVRFTRRRIMHNYNIQVYVCVHVQFVGISNLHCSD
jgi:hypothetical protein